MNLYFCFTLPPILPSFFPSFYPSFLPSFYPSFLPSYLPSFLPPFLPSFVRPFPILTVVRSSSLEEMHNELYYYGIVNLKIIILGRILILDRCKMLLSYVLLFVGIFRISLHVKSLSLSLSPLSRSRSISSYLSVSLSFCRSLFLLPSLLPFLPR